MLIKSDDRYTTVRTARHRQASRIWNTYFQGISGFRKGYRMRIPSRDVGAGRRSLLNPNETLSEYRRSFQCDWRVCMYKSVRKLIIIESMFSNTLLTFRISSRRTLSKFARLPRVICRSNNVTVNNDAPRRERLLVNRSDQFIRA